MKSFYFNSMTLLKYRHFQYGPLIVPINGVWLYILAVAKTDFLFFFHISLNYWKRISEIQVLLFLTLFSIY